MSDRRRQVLGVCALGVLMAFLDVTIVNVAFPDMKRSFVEVSSADLSWVLTAYNVVFSALLVPAGRFADLIGRRRVFLAGLVVFTVASVACALAPTVWVLVAARIAQAVGAAAVIPTSIALLLTEFPPHRRLSATTLLGACAAASSAFGPTAGGLLIELMDWRLVFLVNVPLGVLAVLWGMSVLRESTDPTRGAVPDVLGACCFAIGFGALVLGIVQGRQWGWTSGAVITCAVVSAVLIGITMRRSTRHPAPVIELSLFRLRQVAAGNAALVLFAMSIFAKILVDVLFLTSVWHLRPLYAGLVLAPGPLITAMCAPIAGRLAERYGPRLIATIGVVTYSVGCAWFAVVPGERVDYVAHWLPGSVLTGIGNAMAFPIMTGVAVASLPLARFATGSAVNAAARQLGAVLGVAVVIAILGGSTMTDGAADALVTAFWFTCAAAAFAVFGTVLLGRDNPGMPHPDSGPAAELGPVKAERTPL